MSSTASTTPNGNGKATPSGSPSATPASTKTSTSTVPQVGAIQTNEDALISAWHRFLDFDKVSQYAKNKRTSSRQMILILGGVSSFLAILLSYFDAETSSIARTLALIVLAILPIAVSVLISYASEFAPALSWAVYRVAGELIRREIYFFRLKVGDYDVSNDEERREALRRNIAKAKDLRSVYSTDNLDTRIIKESVEQVLRGNAAQPYFTYMTPEDVKRRVREDVYHHPEDDGFSDLTPDGYFKVRLVPQYQWYTKRINTDYTNLRRLRWIIWFIGGAGSLLVALSALMGVPLERWVAFTTALSAAVAMYLELKMYNHTYLIYSHIAGQMFDLVEEWRVLTGRNNRNISAEKDFVIRAERVMQAEREEWLNRVIQTQTALEQKITRSENRDPNEQSGVQSTILALATLARQALEHKEYLSAWDLYRHALQSAQRLTDESMTVDLILGYARLYNRLPERYPDSANVYAELSAVLYGVVEAHRNRINYSKTNADDVIEREFDASRQVLGAARFRELLSAETALSTTEAVKKVLDMPRPDRQAQPTLENFNP